MRSKGFFLTAYENELYADECFNDNANLKETLGFRMIKPYKLLNKVTSNTWFWKLFLRILVILWPIVNFFLSNLLFTKALFYKLIATKKELHGGKIYLDFSSRLKSLADKLPTDQQPDQWLTLNLNQKAEMHISIYNLTSLGAIIKSWLLSIAAPFYLREISKESYQYLLSYSSFNWFLTFNTLKKQKLNAIYYANHYDRWAILFDRLDVENKTLIQHGILSEKFVPPVKSNSVRQLFCYNKKEADYFLTLIINNDKCAVKYLTSNLQLTSQFTNGKFSILFISCLPMTLHKEVEILAMLPDDILVYIKTHPVFPVNDYLDLNRRFAFELINQHDIYPDADLIISYNSTLAYEYEMSGKSVIFYNDSTAKEITNEIISRMKIK